MAKDGGPRLMGKKIALLAATGVHEHEFWVPYYRFKEEGASLLVAGPERGATYYGEGRHGKDGLRLAATDASIADLNAGDLDALIIPGGIWGPLLLRAHAPALQLVREMNAQRKLIGAICHAQWVLASADVLRGRRATSPDDIAIDLKNAGAEWVKQPAVRDENLVTAIYFGYLPEFMRLLLEALDA
ncbi:MAG: type 1 glutamine amidotransferase [Planctomycetota bacterium]|nr:type 1 glutamine amidotransferase [Planctomycetota bacterium]